MSVRLFASVGTVQVIGWERDSVVISGAVASGSQVCARHAEPGRVAGLKLFVESPTEQAGREGALTMHVPRGARVWLKTGSADVTVSDVTGGLDVNIVGGSITVRGSPRELRAESMDGAVAVDGTPGWMRLKTATGTSRCAAARTSAVDDQRNDRRARWPGGAREARVDDGRHPLRARAGSRCDGRDGDAQRRDRRAASRKTPMEVDAATVTGAIENAWSKSRPVAAAKDAA